MSTVSRSFSMLVGILLAASSMNALASQTSNVMSNPFISKVCKAPEYEPEMIRKEVNGIVKMRFSTDDSGKVIQAKVEESSGNRLVDESSLNALKKCHFSVGKDEVVIPKHSYTIAFRWVVE